MRLGQLARKHDVPVQEIITYLEELTGEKFHPNAKLYDTLESKVFEHFDLMPTTKEVIEEELIDEEPEETVELVVVEEPEIAPIETPESEIAAVEGDLEMALAPEIKPVLETSKEKQEEEKIVPTEDEVIQTDKLLEMLESEEASADLNKIRLIKAPKKELAGLKVVGKVDLPEPKKKEEKPKEEKDTVTERDLREYRQPRRKKRPPLTEEEKEKRRLKAKAKKEAYEAREEKRHKEREAQRLKELKQAHYKQNLQKAEVKKQKQKKKTDPITTQEKRKDTRPKPKTWLGKWWRWMNT